MPELEIGLTNRGRLNFNHFFLQFIENKKQNKTKEKQNKKKIQAKGSSRLNFKS